MATEGIQAQTGLPEKLEPASVATGAETVANYAKLTADFNPIHLDADFASKTPFGRPILHGTIALSLLTQSIENTFGDRETSLDIRFTRPARVGVSLIAAGEQLGGQPGVYAIHVDTDDNTRVVEGTLIVGPQPDASSSLKTEND